MLASYHWNKIFQENSSSYWRIPASEVAGYALKTIPIKRYSQTGTRTPSCCLTRKTSSPPNSRCLFTQKIFWQSKWHFLSLQIICRKQQNQKLFWQITNLSQVFPKQKHCGLHVTVSCKSNSIRLISPVESTWQLTSFEDWNSNSRRRYDSKSGRISKQHSSK